MEDVSGCAPLAGDSAAALGQLNTMRWRRTMRTTMTILLAVVSVCTTSAYGQVDDCGGLLPITSRPAAQDGGAEESERITRSADVLDAIMAADDSAIPDAILERAQGIAVFPGTTRAGFGFGGMRGRGVLSARSGDSWSAPAFLTLTGGSFGLQIGVQRSDIILVIMVPEGLDNLVSNQFSIGVDAGLAAGPVGRNAAAATDLQLSAQILSYSRARGVFAGITINGSTIRQDVDANERFYGSRLETRPIVFEGGGGDREPVGLWRQTLARHAN